MSRINGQTKPEKKIQMQIMTFPLSREVDLGIRMTEIRRIEALGENSDPGESRLYFPHDWFAIPRPDRLSGLKGIFLSSWRDALIAVPRIGRILRLSDPTIPGELHTDHPFLSRHKTVEGPESWVLDIPLLRRHLSGEESSGSPPERQAGESSELFQQVGQTARDIQRVLSLSSSMVDSLKFMEGKLPETSQGLGVISQMTEDAAHKLMNILESLLEDHNRIRSLTRSPTAPSPDQIAGILDGADERIMHGFEAMAFQDLVGQNIKLIGNHLKELEARLVRILIETSPEANRSPEDASSALAPAPPPDQTLKGVGARGDIDQNTVDQLLSEFGF
ncbi:MAG: protein phosphatase CheZ [Nitrospirae bacterium]|nr:protein phosphatase CheZ [Nitrospirota bacterium]